VVTSCTCSEICNDSFSAECVSDRILKLGQYLAKIWTKVCVMFFDSLCIAAEVSAVGRTDKTPSLSLSRDLLVS